MKRFLPLLLFLAFVQFSFSQAPTNDTVENATELTNLNYFESDIRLDLAATNPGSPVGCSTLGFTGVYYKFTATENTFVSASILPTVTGGNIINSFVIAYSAPNLNVTSTDQLTLQPGSNCAFGSQTSFEITIGQSYYIMVHRSDSGALTNFSFSELQDVPQSEKDALIAFYNALGGDNWNNNTNWNTNNPVSTWYGITTASISGQQHVISIWIQNNNFNGELPSALQELTFLSDIVLDQNNISGSLPPELMNLNNLFRISLFGNSLTGNIPAEYQNLPNLQVLNLGSNQLSGTIISDIGNFTSLINLSLHTNNFSGDIPSELGNLNNLQNLYLGNNSFTGNIPVSIGNLTNLVDLDLRNSGISGSIPSEIGNLSNLQSLYLNNNNLSGNIPTELSNANNIFRIVVSDNNLSGPVPSELTNLPNLNELKIEGNNFKFSDFENNFLYYQNNLAQFFYSPQANITEDQIEFIDIGDDIILDTNLTSPNNQYLWFYNGTQLVGEEGSSVVLNDIQPQQMGSYFCFVSNTVVTGLSLSTGTYIVGQDPTISPDYNTLLDLYNSTNGDNWNNNSNWLNPNVPLSGWQGITVNDNNVTGVQLGNNNLQGSLPNSLINLINAESLNFSLNSLSGTIPDFSILTNLQYLGLSNNDYSFLDFETNITNNLNIPFFIYSPQNLIDNEIIIDATIGDDYSFPMTIIDGTSVDYQWYTISKIDPNDLELVSGQNTNVLDLPNLQSIDMDAYKCIATSPFVPGLEIFRNTIELKGPVSQVERDALIAIYNATNGPNWFNTVNWNTTTPVSTWTGVTTTGNKVTTLNISGYGLIGQLPNDITNLSNLEALYIGLGDTGLTGTIPSNIGDLTELKVFWIQGTGMSGDIPDSFGNLLNLYEIRFLANNFTGILPASISNLTELISVQMTGNEIFGNRSSFSGPIPFNAPNAQIFLQENNFDFGDLEPFVQAGNYVTFGYSPQNTDDLAESIDSGAGVDITLNVNDTNLSRSTNTDINNNYQWYKDNIAITGANAANYTIVNAQIIDSGEYFCEITNPVLPDLTIVRAPITVNIDKELGINELDKNEITLYPNPAQNWLTVNTNNLVDAMLSIYDVKGSLVISKNINGSKNALNIEALQSGVYIIQINDNVSVLTRRFIKQ